MKILEVFGEPISNGGQESFVFNILKHMDLTDIQVDLLTPYYCDNDYYKSQMKMIGSEIYTFGLPFTPGKSRKNIEKKLVEFLKKNKYDVVHIHSGSVSVLGIVAKAAKKNNVKKVIVHSHSSGVGHSFKHMAAKFLANWNINKYADCYMACSMEAGMWKFSSSVCKNELKIINNGIDLNRFRFNNEKRDEYRKKLNINKEKIVIGHVGRFTYEKNHVFLIQVFAELVKNNPNYLLMLVGGGELEDAIKQQIKDLEIENNVMMIGTVSNVEDYMNCMDIFLFPSLFEGLGLVAVEAQACGLPVIVSDAVPRNIEFSENVKFLQLDKNIWVDAVSEFSNLKRYDITETIIQRRFEISEISREVREIYLD